MVALGSFEGRTFIEEFGRTFGTKQVRVTPGDQRPGRTVETFEGQVQDKGVGFNVDTPVYEGDQMEWDDPRGGTRVVWVTAAHVRDPGGSFPSHMKHVMAEYSDRRPTSERDAPGATGHVIVVNGSHVNIAVDGSTVTQQVPVAPGFEELADRVGQAIATIEEAAALDPDEVEVAREVGAQILEEASKPTPDTKLIKRALPTLRGVLQSVVNAGAGAAASGLVAQLFV
ncbi:hypothetical protein [Microbacterium sp. gxy059]|uniref:hypothetical protein n=1 Tax=Microbacterium sp. gxy059 TaxID=2957199 RepID=UPI003D979E0B